MDSKDKVTLQRCHSDLLRDLDPTMTFNAKLHRDGIITEEQKDRIEDAGGRQEKVALLLEILPRRGPEAYNKFLAVLQKDYGWLSTKLQNERQTENPKLLTLQEEKTSIERQHTNGPVKSAIKSTVPVMTDTEIKKLVCSHIHKQFGHTRKITERDKRTMERWICELVHQDRNKNQQHLQDKMLSTLTPRSISSGNEKYIRQIDDIRRDLLNIQNMLVEHLPDRFTNKLAFDKIRSQNPVKVLINQINEEVFALIQHKVNMENDIQTCLEIMDDQDDSIEHAVQKTVRKLHEREIALNKEKYRYDVLSEKLEGLKHLEQMYNIQNMQLSTLRNEKYQLEEKCKIFEVKIQQLKEMPNKTQMSSSCNFDEQGKSYDNRTQTIRGVNNNFPSHRKQFRVHRENRNPKNMMNNAIVGHQVRPKMGNLN